MTNYNDLIDFLKKSYSGFDITMGTTNELRSPSIIITLESVTTTDADDDIHSLLSATYTIMFYAESSADFNPLPAVMKFGNLTQLTFDKMADGEVFQSTVTLSGIKPLWV